MANIYATPSPKPRLLSPQSFTTDTTAVSQEVLIYRYMISNAECQTRICMIQNYHPPTLLQEDVQPEVWPTSLSIVPVESAEVALDERRS